MTKMSDNPTNCLFAAMKLVEQLYKDGEISQDVFRKILEDNAANIDTSAFTYCDHINGQF